MIFYTLKYIKKKSNHVMTIQLLSNILSVYINGVVKKKSTFPSERSHKLYLDLFLAVFSSHLIRAVGATFASLQAF